MLLLDLLFDAKDNITSHLLSSVHFIGFQSCVGFSARSQLCVITPFLMAVQDICQVHYLTANPHISFTCLPTLLLSACHLQRGLLEQGFSPSLAPHSGTVSHLTCAPWCPLPHLDSWLSKHIDLRLISCDLFNSTAAPFTSWCTVHTLVICILSFVRLGSGGFFLICEDFGRMFNHSFPACTFFFWSGH